MPNPTTSTKKCPHCGQWSSWQQRADDQCAHCGQLLDPRRYAAEQERAARGRASFAGAAHRNQARR